MDQRTLPLALIGAAALGGALFIALDEAEEAIAEITVASPPARPTVNKFVATRVELSAGACDTVYEIRSGTTPLRTFTVQVRAGSGIGLRYAGDGDVEGYTRNDAAISVGNCFGAFANAAGGFATKAAALEAWHQARQLIPQ